MNNENDGEIMREFIVKQTGSNLDKLMFIFHGYGADKENFIPVANEISQRINNIEIHIPDGIERCDESLGYQWFSFIGDNIYDHRKAFYANKSVIINYLQNVIREKNIVLNKVILSGFSQGAMVALSIGLEIGVGGIISFSGMFIGESDAPIKNKRTKILMTHGDKDTVVLPEAMYNSKKILENRGLDIKTSISRGGQHGIDNTALEAVIRFIASL